MSWEVEWGSQIKTLLDIQKLTGEAPQALQNRPTLDPVHDRLYEAFWLLHGSRTVGAAGPNPIALTEIGAFLDRFPEQTLEAEQAVIRLIRRVDAEVLGKLYEKLKPGA